jgi:hypothetical protein
MVIYHDAGQFRYLSNPTPILFQFKLDSVFHKKILAFSADVEL